MIRSVYSSMLMLLMATGCAQLNSVKRVTDLPAISDTKHPPEGKVVTVDAKQRHLILTPMTETEGGKTTNGWRFCAEAAPDVFSAYAASGGLKGNKNGGDLNFAGSETASTIERTQTINLLRESFYRTCERYASGALTKDQFIVQAARDQRSMVAVLAVEQLTRTARPPSIIISGPATSSTIQNGESAAKLVEEFRAEASGTSSALAAATADFDKKKKVSDCSGTNTPPEGEDEEADKKRQEFAECVEAKTLVATREAENKVAQQRLDKALSLAAATVTSLTASTQAGQTSNGQGGGGSDPADIVYIAETVEKIVTRPALDETLMFCIAYLSNLNEAKMNYAKTLIEACVEIIKERDALDRNLVLQQFTNDQSAKIITDYLDKPTDAQERSRRRTLAQSAARRLGYPSTAIDLLNFLASGDPAQKAQLLGEMVRAEKDAAGKADLAR